MSSAALRPLDRAAAAKPGADLRSGEGIAEHSPSYALGLHGVSAARPNGCEVLFESATARARRNSFGFALGAKRIVSREHAFLDHPGGCAIDKISLAPTIRNSLFHLERHDLFEGTR